MNADLTIDKPWKVLLKYTLPLLGGAVFQQLYTLADTIIAGSFAGQTALTAIGASNALVNILMAFALGANAGCAVLAARYFGKKDNSDVKTTIYTALSRSMRMPSSAAATEMSDSRSVPSPILSSALCSSLY